MFRTNPWLIFKAARVVSQPRWVERWCVVYGKHTSAIKIWVNFVLVISIQKIFKLQGAYSNHKTTFQFIFQLGEAKDLNILLILLNLQYYIGQPYSTFYFMFYVALIAARYMNLFQWRRIICMKRTKLMRVISSQ